MCEKGWEEDASIDAKVVECLHIASVFERAHEFDVIHNSFDFLPLTYSRLVDTPVVTTIHGFSSEQVVDVYASYADVATFVAISDSNRHERLEYVATIHHGVAAPDHGIDSVVAGDRLLFFGRIHPDKGTAEAIDIARRCERPLDIAGIVADTAYFEKHVAPHVDGVDIRYLGPVRADGRDELMASAHALLHPIAFDEPFGFSVAEALSVGTPVVAFDRGSMSELITAGENGHLVSDVNGAVAAVRRCGSLDRTQIRLDAATRFSLDEMVDRYVDAYRTVVDARSNTR